MVTTTAKLALKSKGEPIRLSGCPVSVSEQVLMLCALSDVQNPILDPENAIQFNKAYLAWRAKMVAKRLTGHPYQTPGPTERGDGAPEVSARPEA
jgi:hypothetical protein